jgi:hypothetical protein
MNIHEQTLHDRIREWLKNRQGGKRLTYHIEEGVVNIEAFIASVEETLEGKRYKVELSDLKVATTSHGGVLINFKVAVRRKVKRLKRITNKNGERH